MAWDENDHRMFQLVMRWIYEGMNMKDDEDWPGEKLDLLIEEEEAFKKAEEIKWMNGVGGHE